MTRLFTAAAIALFGLAGMASSASADTCFMCKSSSSKDKCAGADYCKSVSGKDTSDDRKKCRELGCDIGGTSSCPTSANRKVCTASLWEAPSPTDTMASFADFFTGAAR